MSVSYSEVDEATGKVISDNNRKDRVVLDQSMIQKIDELGDYATEFIKED